MVIFLFNSINAPTMYAVLRKPQLNKKVTTMSLMLYKTLRTNIYVISIPFAPFSPIQAFPPLPWMDILSIPQQDH